MKQVTAYECEFCKKLYKTVKGITTHETRCSKNPENDRVCYSCINLIKKKTIQYLNTTYGNDNKKVELLYCEKRKVFLYPPIVEHKQNWIDSADLENEVPNLPMPKVCEILEDENKEFDKIFNNQFKK